MLIINEIIVVLKENCSRLLYLKKIKKDNRGKHRMQSVGGRSTREHTLKELELTMSEFFLLMRLLRTSLRELILVVTYSQPNQVQACKSFSSWP